MSELRIEHPNRDKAESKATKAIVVLLLLVSAGLISVSYTHLTLPTILLV